MRTPTRFWKWFNLKDFEQTFEVVASGNFGEVKKAKFKSSIFLKLHHHPIFGSQYIALKDPKGDFYDWLQQQYSLSYVSILFKILNIYLNSIGS